MTSIVKKKWELTIMELEQSEGKLYKVTRRFPELSIAETKVFKSKAEAEQQFNIWLP